MSNPRRRRPNYDRKLTRPIELPDGTRLIALRDAANLFSERFATVREWRTLEVAIDCLIEAAEFGGRERVEAATSAIERVLRARRLLGQ